jgi:hypothetical protein
MSTKIILKKLKELGTIWHPESTLVFKSKDDKVVIGRWDKSEFIDLDDTAIESCEKWGFKIDESLIEEEVSEPQNEEEEEPQEEEVPEPQEDKVSEEVPEPQEEQVSEEPQEEQVSEEVPEPQEDKEEVRVTDEEGNIMSQIKQVFENLSSCQKELVRKEDELRLNNDKLIAVNIEFDALKLKFSSLKSLLV